jgi:hypothetical protein
MNEDLRFTIYDLRFTIYDLRHPTLTGPSDSVRSVSNCRTAELSSSDSDRSSGLCQVDPVTAELQNRRTFFIRL